MKINQCLLFILILSMSCHTPAVKPAPTPLKAEDTTKAISHLDTQIKNDSAFVLNTHLKDTTYAAGSFILFLRPDDASMLSWRRRLKAKQEMEMLTLAPASVALKTA